MATLELFLLGPPHIKRDGASIEVDRRKAIALIVYLAITNDAHTRDALATLFWPELDQTRALGALRKTLWVLKKAIGDDWLEADRKSLALRRSAGFWLDVDHFHNLLAECNSHHHAVNQVCPDCLIPLTEAVSLYRDDFLAGFTLDDSPGFDDWLLAQSESLRRDVSHALERLVRGCSEQRDFKRAIEYAKRWLRLDPLYEPAHCWLMCLYVGADQRAAALRQYVKCVELLEQELGVPPQEETTRLYQAIKENRALPPIGSTFLLSFTCPHNLPLSPTPFIDREEELAKIDRLLKKPDCRLLTLVGPGGIGKTRLAIQAAEDKIGSFPHGVYFVPLAPLSSADFLVPTIADVLGFSFHSSADPKEQLLNYLRERELLLLLDNFEHLLDGAGAGDDGAALVADILRRVPGTKLLITSRERLNLQWEWVFEVEGLRCPPNGKLTALEGYSAVQLFLQSASRAYLGFSLVEEQMPHAVRICQLMDGLPLGIELAAAWVETSTCQEIAREIERSLDLLASSMRDVLARHRSLWAAFDHSWNLLSPEERGVFRKLSVFRGGFRAAAAQQVADASPALLLALMHKSLLRKGAAGRYEMLEVMRQYAEEKLRQAPQEWDETHGRHCEYYVEFLHNREKHLEGEKQREAMEEIGQDIENVHVAWQWAVEHRKEEEIGKSLESLSLFYEMRRWLREGREALEKAAQGLRRVDDTRGEPEEAQGILFGKILAQQGRLCHLHSRFEEARRLSRQSLVVFRYLGARKEMGLPLNNLGFVAWWRGNQTDAKRLFQESLAICKESGNQWEMASCLYGLGLVTFALNEYAEAKRVSQESLTMYRQIGWRTGIATSLINLGSITFVLGEYKEAKECCREALEAAINAQVIGVVLEALVGMVTVLTIEGEEAQASEIIDRTLRHPQVYKEIKARAEHLFSRLESELLPFLSHQPATYEMVQRSASEIRKKAEQLLSEASGQARPVRPKLLPENG